MAEEYAAFISYRHLPLDKRVAERIERTIENYRVPRELRARVGGKRLGKVFRDEDELPLSASLSGSIRQALESSRFLIDERERVGVCTLPSPLGKVPRRGG